MNSKERDQEYGVQPKHRELKREDLPHTPARKPTGYCKKAKGEHAYTLFGVKIHSHHSWIAGELLVVGFSRWKEYRCDGCEKKKLEWETIYLDAPVKELAQV